MNSEDLVLGGLDLNVMENSELILFCSVERSCEADVFRKGKDNLLTKCFLLEASCN